MNFSECCLPLSKACKPNLSSQAKLVCGIFDVLGSKFFSYTSTDDYPRSICTGKKPLTNEMKTGVSHPFKTDELADFFFNNINNDKIEQLKTAYEFSANTDVEKNSFCIAIARQLRLIFESDRSDVANIILEEYEHIQLGDSETASNCYAPLYPGDDVLDYSKPLVQDVNTYQKFFIELEIVNTGSVPWMDRRLVYQRPSTSGPLPIGENVIALPTTVRPKGTFRKTIEMDARGSEGYFRCRFEMQDSDDNNCFPGREKFDYRVNVMFDLTTE